MPLTAQSTTRVVVAVKLWAALVLLVGLLLGVLGMHMLNGSTGASGHSGMAITVQPVAAESAVASAAADAGAVASTPAAVFAQAATAFAGASMPGTPVHVLGTMACLLILVISALVLGPVLSRNGLLLPPSTRVLAVFRALRDSIPAPSLVALSVDRR